MTILRKDLFPHLVDDLFQNRENTINVWVNEAFQALESLFSSSKEKFIEYVNSIKDRQSAELFIRLSMFYLIAKKYEKSIFSKMIMLIAIIDRLSSKEEYVPFQDWISSRAQNDGVKKYLQNSEESDFDKFKKTIDLLKEDYYDIFGSQRNVIKFFKNHVSTEDKIRIIKSFRAKRTSYVDGFNFRMHGKTQFSKVNNMEELRGYFGVSKGLMPECYHWKYCYVGYGECCPDMGCLLKENNEFLEEKLKKIVSMIYQIRSDAVHNAIFPPISEGEVNFVYTIIDKKPVIIEITIEDLQNIFEKAFKNYFDKIQIS